MDTVCEMDFLERLGSEGLIIPKLAIFSLDGARLDAFVKEGAIRLTADDLIGGNNEEPRNLANCAVCVVIDERWPDSQDTSLYERRAYIEPVSQMWYACSCGLWEDSADFAWIWGGTLLAYIKTVSGSEVEFALLPRELPESVIEERRARREEIIRQREPAPGAS